MANDNKNIGDIVKKCKILLLDIEGTTTSISFVKDKLFPYAEENVKQFLESGWDNDDVKEAVSALRKLALEDQEKSVEGVVAISGEDSTKEDQINSLVKNVKWQMSSDRKAGPLKQLQGLIWKQGYDNGDIKGHVFDDVSSALEQWHSAENQKVYIYSSGSVQAQKLLFGQSLAGDLLTFIDGHFDTAVGAKQEAASYAAIVEKIGCKADEVLFLTDIVKEAEAARSSGLNVALVSREGNAPLEADAVASFAVIHSLAELTVSNKRKTDPQEDEQPAKVPKTDESMDVTTRVEPQVSETDGAVGTKNSAEEPEKMEVEEEIEETNKEVPESAEKTCVIVAETTETNDVTVETQTKDVEVMESKAVESVESMETEDVVNKPTEVVEDKPTEVENKPTGIVENKQAEVVDNKQDEVVENKQTEVVENEQTEVVEKKQIEVVENKQIEVVENKQTEVGKKPTEVVDNKQTEVVENKQIEVVENKQTEVVENKQTEVGKKPTEVHLTGTVENKTTEIIENKETVPVEIKNNEPAENKTSESVENKETIEDTIVVQSKETVENKETIPVEVKDTEPVKKEKIVPVDVKETTVVENEGRKISKMESENKTEIEKETELMEVDVKDTQEIKDAVIETSEIKSKESTDVPDNVVAESPEVPNTESDNNVKEKTTIAEETPPAVITEIMEITNDKDIISEVTEVIEDIDPIVEEPVLTEEIEQLQNVGDILDKECDEILSKVEDVTNLDNFNVKPILNPIVEEPMETENVDSNDIVDRILDTEMELEMKKCADVDINPITENTEKVDSIVSEQSLPTEVSPSETNSIPAVKVTENSEKEIDNTEHVASNSSLTEQEPVPIESNETEIKQKKENQDTLESEKLAAVEAKIDTEESPASEKLDEEQVNGKQATNGDTEIKQNGDTCSDASNGDELSSRLSAGNGEDVVNGSNGDANEVANGSGDNKLETDVTEIKVKTVATEEPPTDLIEQPTEA